MAKDDLRYSDRVFPSLIDRLTGVALQSRRIRFAAFLKDLEWLLNSRADRFLRPDGSNQLDEYPEVAKSVLNFGIPDLSGRGISDVDLGWLEERVSQAIHDFEPRLVPGKLKVEAKLLHDSIGFRIEGELRNLEPIPEAFEAIMFNIDLETGKCTFGQR